ncbi:glycosyltransferase family A protein [Chryseobacterium wangxinyae]|uniref:glycosyltransferase family 2 protein n=1 Tax=Chryseobacterium sp. CY350 TaxID=2997336 RepID=UPI00226E907F|nr:glycosyltransferase family A protein [Chryseobacterium sp. CY350]MCY0975824.1 glycosyltransferase family A protein [Chryseobacterium sp. CY350]WBZ94567.1 glycosyltransferase family A protein [Chryseobacterium sp. CY350]
MQKTLISIIVPCYNQAQYLDACLQSVLDQTYQDWECIIVNDGSPDNTGEVAKVWLNKDIRFKYLYKENGGLSSARNTGIEVAEGEWILPLDADDKIGNLYLELAKREFTKDYSVIYCQGEYFGDKSGKWELPDFSKKELANGNPIFCSAFFRRSDWKKVGGYDINMIFGIEDWEFWISLLKTDNKVYKIPVVCFYYRIKNQSMITGLNMENKIKMLKYIEAKHIEFFHEHLGSLHLLNKEKNRYKVLLEKSNRKLDSKRYKLIDKIFSIFNK